MQFDLAIHTLVSVKTPGARSGQDGWIVNRFNQTRTLYAVQFDDKCIGYFERAELEEITSEKATSNKSDNKEFDDITELETRS